MNKINIQGQHIKIYNQGNNLGNNIIVDSYDHKAYRMDKHAVPQPIKCTEHNREHLIYDFIERGLWCNQCAYEGKL